MILAITLYIQLLLLLIFLVYPKRLHLYEIFFIWMVVWLITYSIITSLMLNLKIFELSTKITDFWTHFFLVLLLYPLIVTVFFDFYLKISSALLKWGLMGLCTLLLTASQFLLFRLGVLINHNQTFAASYWEWGLSVFFTFICWQWYRKKRLVR